MNWVLYPTPKVEYGLPTSIGEYASGGSGLPVAATLIRLPNSAKLNIMPP